MKKFAITDEFVLSVHGYCELRWEPLAITGKNLFKEDISLFSGENAQRKLHESRVRRQFRKRIEIVLSEFRKVRRRVRIMGFLTI